MFSSPQTLERRTGKKGTSRYDYLNEIITEFNTTDSEEYKQQILANLTNFAYDPINYEYFRRLNVLDIFLNTINECQLNTEINIKKVGFAISGICNLTLDEKNKEYLLTKSNLIQMLKLILSTYKGNEDIILINILTIFVFVNNDLVKNEINTDSNLVDVVKKLVYSKNRSLSNIATVFLEDFNISNK